MFAYDLFPAPDNDQLLCFTANERTDSSPWLEGKTSKSAEIHCTQVLVGLLINQTN